MMFDSGRSGAARLVLSGSIGRAFWGPSNSPQFRFLLKGLYCSCHVGVAAGSWACVSLSFSFLNCKQDLDWDTIVFVANPVLFLYWFSYPFFLSCCSCGGLSLFICCRHFFSKLKSSVDLCACYCFAEIFLLYLLECHYLVFFCKALSFFIRCLFLL